MTSTATPPAPDSPSSLPAMTQELRPRAPDRQRAPLIPGRGDTWLDRGRLVGHRNPRCSPLRRRPVHSGGGERPHRRSPVRIRAGLGDAGRALSAVHRPATDDGPPRRPFHGSTAVWLRSAGPRPCTRCSAGCGRRPCWAWSCGCSCGYAPAAQSKPRGGCCTRSSRCLTVASIGGGFQTVSETLDARPTRRRANWSTSADADCICTAPAPAAPPSSWNPVTEEAPLTRDGSRRQSPATAESASTTARVAGGATPPTGPQDAAQIAADLHTLLDRAHVPGPYVLAGHSFGGLYTLTFAARYPDQVAGMVLLDSTAPRPGPAPPTTGESLGVLGRFLAVAPAIAHLGVARLIAQVRWRSTATLGGRGAGQRVDRPPPRQLHRGIPPGFHLDAAGGGPD